jgi:hypothetical protein
MVQIMDLPQTFLTQIKMQTDLKANDLNDCLIIEPVYDKHCLSNSNHLPPILIQQCSNETFEWAINIQTLYFWILGEHKTNSATLRPALGKI